MTLGFGVFDFTPHPLEDERFRLLDGTVFAALRALMNLFLRRLLRPLREHAAGELSRQFVPNLDGQSLQISEGPGCLKFFFLRDCQLSRHLPNPPPQLIIHDQSPVSFLS